MPRILTDSNFKQRRSFTSPRLRGEVASSRQRSCAVRLRAGEGDSRHARFRGGSPSPGALAIALSPTSPRKRGEVKPAPLRETRFRDLAARSARVLPETSRLLKSEGAGNAGRAMRPQPRVR